MGSRTARHEEREAPAAEPATPPLRVRLQQLAARYVTSPRWHVRVYRATAGVIGSRLPTVPPPVLLLTTVGRRSGRPRTTPVVFFRDADRYVIAATNNGTGAHPAWLLNLSEHPEATIQVRSEVLRVTATEATGPLRERLWSAMEAAHPLFAEYARRAPRPIPVVVLERTGAPTGTEPATDTATLRTATVLSGLGHVVHNVEEFGLGWLGLGQTLLPAAVTVAFLVGARRPTRGYLWALGAWGLLVVVAGGGSVFPVGFLPFTPAQTLSHYLAHLAYAVLQVPLLVSVWRRLRVDARTAVAQ